MNRNSLVLGAVLAASALLCAAVAQAPKAVLLRVDRRYAENGAVSYTNVVGALEGTRWVEADQLSASSVAAIRNGLSLTLLTPTGPRGVVKGGGKFQAPTGGDPCDWTRETSIGALPPMNFPAYALSAAWNPVPRAVQSLPLNNAVYLKVVVDELRARGVKASAQLSQLLRVDLDGDKADEIVILAQRPAPRFVDFRLQSTYENAVGDYSLVLVRKVIAGKVKTFTLGERRVDKLFTGNGDGQPVVLTQWVSAIADIDGDGRMEIFVDDMVHEGEGVTVFRWNGSRYDKLLEWGCGV